jgi:hypothetical protein
MDNNNSGGAWPFVTLAIAVIIAAFVLLILFQMRFPGA